MGFWIIVAFVCIILFIILFVDRTETRLMLIEDWVARQKVARDHRRSKFIFEELEKR